jgi:hypothetical protein
VPTLLTKCPVLPSGEGTPVFGRVDRQHRDLAEAPVGVDDGGDEAADSPIAVCGPGVVRGRREECDVVPVHVTQFIAAPEAQLLLG